MSILLRRTKANKILADVTRTLGHSSENSQPSCGYCGLANYATTTAATSTATSSLQIAQRNSPHLLHCGSGQRPPPRLYCFFHKYKSIMNAPEGIFRGCVDRFNGITVDSCAEFEENVDFPEKLQKSLDYWIKNNYRAIWFRVEIGHAKWIPHLSKCGFDFHHANQGYVFMCRWLPTKEHANIPVYAHTMVGVGGLVINDENEILVVSERYALIPNSWKLPGGYVEPGEDLIDAAIREVKEETGVDCDFSTVVSMRHTHGGSFGTSDMYIVIGLKPKNLNLTRCEREIAKIQWMPVAEYLEHPNVHETNRHFARTLLDYKRRGLRFACEKSTHVVLKKEYCLYYMQPLEDTSATNCSTTVTTKE